MGDASSSNETLISKLDPSNPLYLHPSDSSNLSIISTKLKGTENYFVWANAMKLALQVKNKLGFVTCKCLRPTENQVLIDQWDRCNSIVLTWILNSVCEELYVGQVYSQQAYEVWEELRETYEKIDGLVVFNLYQKINVLNQNGSSVSDYYHSLTSMWKQFDAMVQLPSCSCQASKGFNDFSQLIKLMQFLMGLDDIYQPVRTNLLTREPLPTVKVAFSIVSREESHRNSSGSSKGQTQNVGFVSKNSQNFDNRKKFNRGPNPNFKCDHCNKIGHTMERCFELVGYPQSNKPKPTTKQFSSNNSYPGKSSTSNCVTNSLTPEQVTKLLGLLNEKGDDRQQISNVGGFTHKENPGDW
ncbi:uncharacterized protein LOC143595282 [Bidens hawaiensis]|uniref:uncharacterized protein LOC143595282 n=1 Tax=Bidens hawaiensis TaxID=980011 RepID=UPI00404938EA